MKVAIGLGSNLGNRKDHMQRAFEFLTSLSSRESRFSSLYETSPVNCPPQSDAFLNAAALIEWRGDLEELLQKLLAFEVSMGRPATRPFNEPRIIDTDILLAEDQVIHSKTLDIPHPRMMERLFVLEPLAEIWPDAIIPSTHTTVQAALIEARARYGDQQVCRQIASQ